jgi:hypothetical protein
MTRSGDGRQSRTYRRPMAHPSGDATVLVEARELFAAFRWRSCVERLAAADAEGLLDGEALTLLGQTAHLIGADEQSATALARAYRQSLEAGDVHAAARAALWGALVLGSGWPPVTAMRSCCAGSPSGSPSC